MVAAIGEIITAVFAVIGIYELVSQICNYFVRKTKNSRSYKTQIRVFINAENSAHAEFVIRSLLSGCDNGLLKDAEIILIDEGMNEEAKKISRIFSEAVPRVSVEKL